MILQHVQHQFHATERGIGSGITYLALMRVTQARARTEPVTAIAIGNDARHARGHQCLCGLVLEHRYETAFGQTLHARLRTHPDRRIRCREQAQYHARPRMVERRRGFEHAITQDHQPGAGRHEQAPIGHRQQIQDVVGRQPALVLIAGTKHLHRIGLRIQTIQAAVIATEPDHAIILRSDGPHITQRDTRIGFGRIAPEGTTIHIQHADAAAFRANPDAILRIHMQHLHGIARQGRGIVHRVPIDGELHTVVTRQSILRGNPQVAGSILLQCIHIGGRQTIGMGHLHEQRRLRQLHGLRNAQPEAYGHPARDPSAHRRPLSSSPTRILAMAGLRAQALQCHVPAFIAPACHVPANPCATSSPLRSCWARRCCC